MRAPIPPAKMTTFITVQSSLKETKQPLLIDIQQIIDTIMGNNTMTVSTKHGRRPYFKFSKGVANIIIRIYSLIY